jgi:hypothetical protein
MPVNIDIIYVYRKLAVCAVHGLMAGYTDFSVG